jgi:mannitol/fructose-specific phosphotransferase system IIA component
VSTFMGNGLAIPHGTNDAKSAIRHTAISFVRYAETIDWNGKAAEFVVGIAGAGDDHLTVLSRLAEVFMDEAEIARLRATTSAEGVLAVLGDVQV